MEPNAIEKERLARNVKNLQEEIKSYELQKLAHFDLTERIRNLGNDKARLQSEIEVLNESHKRASLRLSETESSLKVKLEELSKVDSKLVTMNRLLDKVTKAEYDNSEELKNKRNEIAVLDKEKASRQEEAQKLNQKIGRLQDNIKSLEDTLFSLENNLLAVRKNLDNSSRELGLRNNVIKELDRHTAKLQTSIEGLKREQNAIVKKKEDLRKAKEEDYSQRERQLQRIVLDIASSKEEVKERERILGNKVIALKKIKSDLEEHLGKKIPLEI